jgi:hypothetical protein
VAEHLRRWRQHQALPDKVFEDDQFCTFDDHLEMARASFHVAESDMMLMCILGSGKELF